jgi:SET domain
MEGQPQKDNEDDDDDDDDDDCFRVWLGGGLSPNDVTASAWELESVDEEGVDFVNNTTPSNNNDDDEDDDAPNKANTAPSPRHIPEHVRKLQCSSAPPKTLATAATEPCFALAYTMETANCHGAAAAAVWQQRPPVCIVDWSERGRGNALVATRYIAAQQVIFTERAAVATQMRTSTTQKHTDHMDDGDGESSVNCIVRACQYCFRSLEPASSCRRLWHGAATALLPRADLWPVPELQFGANDHGTDCATTKPENRLRRDLYNRVQCWSCQSWFCSPQCDAAFQAQYNSCCLVTRAMHMLGTLYRQAHAGAIPPALPLAIRMWAMQLQSRRCNNSECEILNGLCGQAANAPVLELGLPLENNVMSSSAVRYTLEPIHDNLVQIWNLSLPEQEEFTINYFATLTTQAARNGFGMRTQSPFKSYYSALLRTSILSGGRGSDQHAALVHQVARALGSDTLERGMDRQVEAVTCPEIVALFPLVARINHACGTACNAQVSSQEYLDHHVDVVALRDIECGEEITISYIYSGRKSGPRRRRELQAKYLFLCHCSHCSLNP